MRRKENKKKGSRRETEPEEKRTGKERNRRIRGAGIGHHDCHLAPPKPHFSPCSLPSRTLYFLYLPTPIGEVSDRRHSS